MPIRSSLDIDFHDLDGLPRARLRARWREAFGEQPAAAFGRELLALGIAYALQDRRFGGLSKSRAREIDRLFEHAPITPRGEGRLPAGTVMRPGTVLVREWQGTIHQVTVLADGYGWNGQHHASLSGIAQAITGTKWNGPRFFGLREADHAKNGIRALFSKCRKSRADLAAAAGVEHFGLQSNCANSVSYFFQSGFSVCCISWINENRYASC